MTILAGTKRDWEGVFSAWSKPPGKTEQERCDRAVRAIKDAIVADPTLSIRSVRTFPQGSYRNRTNVRQDSDVDVCVLCENTFCYDLPPGISAQNAGITPATYKFGSYKNDVERALVNNLGRSKVQRGNKAFDVNESSRRVDADAAPCFVYRRYVTSWSGGLQYHEGTALIADDTRRRITNFPQQQYDNGVAKNEATNRRFKRAVRIVKKLSHEMEDAGRHIGKGRGLIPDREPNMECAGFSFRHSVAARYDPGCRRSPLGAHTRRRHMPNMDRRERDQALVLRFAVVDTPPGQSISL